MPTELPRCCRCQTPAICQYEGRYCCDFCLPQLRREWRERNAAPYELTEEDRERLNEELDLLKDRPARVETHALVIEGTHIRLKTAKEFARQSGNRFGVPPELAGSLAETVGKASSVVIDDEDDPFNF